MQEARALSSYWQLYMLKMSYFKFIFLIEFYISIILQGNLLNILLRLMVFATTLLTFSMLFSDKLWVFLLLDSSKCQIEMEQIAIKTVKVISYIGFVIFILYILWGQEHEWKRYDWNIFRFWHLFYFKLTS